VLGARIEVAATHAAATDEPQVNPLLGRAGAVSPARPSGRAAKPMAVMVAAFSRKLRRVR
jgi:hypothetical protein